MTNLGTETDKNTESAPEPYCEHGVPIDIECEFCGPLEGGDS